MKKILFAVLTLSVHTTVYAIDAGDYGYGYRSHGYNSLEQQQQTEHDVAAMQRVQVLAELEQANRQRQNDAIDAERFLQMQQDDMNIGEE